MHPNLKIRIVPADTVYLQGVWLTPDASISSLFGPDPAHPFDPPCSMHTLMAKACTLLTRVSVFATSCTPSKTHSYSSGRPLDTHAVLLRSFRLHPDLGLRCGASGKWRYMPCLICRCRSSNTCTYRTMNGSFRPSSTGYHRSTMIRQRPKSAWRLPCRSTSRS